MNIITCLPSCLSCGIFNQWIELEDVARLDSSFCGKQSRPALLELLSSAECVIETKMKSSGRTILTWLLMREVKVRYFYISKNVEEDLGVLYMKMHGPFVTTIVRETECSPQCIIGVEIVVQAFSHCHLARLQYYNISIPFLNEILSRGQSLRELCFCILRGCEGVLIPFALLPSISHLSLSGKDVSLVLDVISRCPNLRKLEVNCFYTDLIDSDLVWISENNRNLRFLGLCGCVCSAPAFIAMTTLCTDIVNLDLYLTTVTDEVIESIAVNMKHLRALNLQYCSNLTNLSLQSLAEHRALTLQNLWLRGNIHITSNAVVNLKSKAPALVVHWYLCLQSADMQISSTDYAACTFLEVDTPTQNLLSVATQCTNLRVLFLYDIQHLRFAAVSSSETAVMNEIVHCCPHLHTFITSDSDLSAVKSVMKSIVSDITVTSSTACLYARLYDFSI